MSFFLNTKKIKVTGHFTYLVKSVIMHKQKERMVKQANKA